jgi:hypothetical protein
MLTKGDQMDQEHLLPEETRTVTNDNIVVLCALGHGERRRPAQNIGELAALLLALFDAPSPEPYHQRFKEAFLLFEGELP